MCSTFSFSFKREIITMIVSKFDTHACKIGLNNRCKVALHFCLLNIFLPLFKKMHKIIHLPKSVLEKKRGWNDTNLNNLFFQEVKIPNGRDIELQQGVRSCGLSSPGASNIYI